MISNDIYNNTAEATGGNYLSAGAYFMRILSVKDDTQYNRLVCECDIAEGENSGYSADKMEKYGFCPLTLKISYTEKAMPFFKKRIKEIEGANGSYAFAPDKFELLKGKFFYGVIWEREYKNKNGEIKTAWNVDTISKKSYAEGTYKVPEKVCLERETVAEPTFTSAEDDLPF